MKREVAWTVLYLLFFLGTTSSLIAETKVLDGKVAGYIRDDIELILNCTDEAFFIAATDIPGKFLHIRQELPEIRKFDIEFAGNITNEYDVFLEREIERYYKPGCARISIIKDSKFPDERWVSKIELIGDKWSINGITIGSYLGSAFGVEVLGGISSLIIVGDGIDFIGIADREQYAEDLYDPFYYRLFIELNQNIVTVVRLEAFERKGD